MDMSDQAAFKLQTIDSLSKMTPEDWDACAVSASGLTSDPFVTYRFLKALEDSGSVGPGTGWQPFHLIAHDTAGVAAVMPLYAKSHSQGEYVFDHNWAHAYETAGGAYYPKLQSAVPFTPVSGPRLLCRESNASGMQSALLQGLIQTALNHQLSSAHITFCTEAEYQFGAQAGLLQRTGQQFHWINEDYVDFEAFLTALSSRKRKNIRKERNTAQNFGGQILQFQGDAIQPDHWDAFWRFYQDTSARKWGMPYLTRSFFEILHADMRDDLLLIMCQHEGHWVAGALNFIGQECLYGRYWGCVADYPCLHFEVCYYQAIDYAIRHRLARVEAGAQGAHKLARGYLPKPTYSLHWIADPGFRTAVAQYLDAERKAVDEDIEILTDYGPFKKTQEREADG